MSWEIVIGLETHAQLSTVSKMFSGASTAFGAAPNTQASAVDIALPGVLPVANRGAVERAICFGLAVGGTINKASVFARKNYFYPDLPKAYQISQYELPIVQGGAIAILTKAGEKSIRLTRAHLEEDAGKSIHGEALSGVFGVGEYGLATFDTPLTNESRDLTKLSAIDLNRAGVPLLEIVSEPEMHSAEEAVAYAKTLHSLVRWIGICDGNMQEGSFRCDANVSVRHPGAPLGTRCEIKNLNSFRFMEKAIEFEVKRQIEILEAGGKIVQETRLYDAERDETRSMRTKEEAHDYRYFPDPDLLPLVISEEWIRRVQSELPELRESRRERFQRDYELSRYDATLLTSTRFVADYFEELSRNMISLGAPKKDADSLSASFLSGEISNWLNSNQLDIETSGLRSSWLASLLIRVQDQTISRSVARAILPGMWAIANKIRNAGKVGDVKTYAEEEFSVDEIIAEADVKQITDTRELDEIIDKVLAANAKQVEDYRSGKDKAFNSLVGQVMKATKGKANPAQVNEILKRKLGR